MTEKHETKVRDMPAAGWVIAYALLATIGAASFALYSIGLPFIADQGLPHVLLASFTAVAIASLYVASTHPRGLFCPWMNLGWVMVIVTPALGALTYAFPNPLTVGATMVFSLPAAYCWALSAAGAWHEVRDAAGVISDQTVG
jgi:hypothetical protein